MKMSSKNILALMLILMIFVSFQIPLKKPTDDRHTKQGYIPKSGFVPDKITAIRIAEAIWEPIYGKSIYRKRPYVVKLKANTWIVEGNLPLNSEGGVPYIEIQKEDGKILKVMHEK